jgi:hypothetical protein
LVVRGFSRDIRVVDAFFVVYESLVSVTLKWVRKYWSARGITGHKSAGPLRVCVNIADCCDPSSAGTLTCIKSLKMFYESTFATVSEQFAIADRFFLFGDDDYDW